MTRDALIEAMARAFYLKKHEGSTSHCAPWEEARGWRYSGTYRDMATTALSAIEGMGVVVPREATEAMVGAFQEGMVREFGMQTTKGYHRRIYAAMTAASPYAPKENADGA